MLAIPSMSIFTPVATMSSLGCTLDEQQCCHTCTLMCICVCVCVDKRRRQLQPPVSSGQPSWTSRSALSRFSPSPTQAAWTRSALVALPTLCSSASTVHPPVDDTITQTHAHTYTHTYTNGYIRTHMYTRRSLAQCLCLLQWDWTNKWLVSFRRHVNRVCDKSIILSRANCWPCPRWLCLG